MRYLAILLALSLSLPAEGKWLLPHNGKVHARFPDHLEGAISDIADTPFQAQLDRLLDKALDNDPKSKELDRLVNKYRTPKERAIANTKDGFDYMIPYRGFGPSKEAGNVVLGENVKIKSRSAAEYARQSHIDEKHLLIVTNVMHLAMGMGMSDRDQGNPICNEAIRSLNQLVGEEETTKTIQLLSTWLTNLEVSDSVYERPVWNILDKSTKFRRVLVRSLDEDPVVRQVVKQVHKYNQKSKFAMVSASIIETALGAASLTPMFIGPAAKIALLTFIMSTGGPELSKVMKELYLDKRLESRFAVFSEETHLALESYQLGILTRNPLLLAMSESLINEMVGPETTKQVLGNSVF